MLIIPAIDIIDGKCVRLRQGDYEQKTIYAASPAEVARQFSDAGLRFLHIVDLEGAKEKRIVNWDSISSILNIPDLQIEIGGGIRTEDDIERLIDDGAARVVVGSVAAKSPELVESWIKKFGAERIVIGMDVKNGSVAVGGWLEDGNIDPVNFINNLIECGAKIFICTDISRDGMLGGVNIRFFQNLKSAFSNISIIASGGISTLDDIKKLKEEKLSGAIVGKAIYEGKISIDELAKMSGAAC
jgi:phosphoribosylformimino-5-aminoimidazole carboxamide ribotide isomerase